MTRLITVTLSDNRSAWVNTSHIVYIKDSDLMLNHSVLIMSNSYQIVVKQRLDELACMINEVINDK